MKKIKVLLIVFVVVVSCFIPSACSNDSEQKSKYIINATYNETEKCIDASMKLDYINNYDVSLDNLLMHLYPRAYRENAKISPITDTQKAYPNGISYGDLTILNLKVDGVEQQINLKGEDEDKLLVSLSLFPQSRTTIEIDFKLQLPNVRHRLGYFENIINLGNWYPIASVYKNGEFSSHPYYSNGDPFFSEVADYEVSITTDTKYTVATSGLNHTKTENGKKITTAKINSARDFSAVIGEFNVKSQIKDGVEFNYYYIEDEKANEHLQTAIDSVATFNNLFGEYAYDSLSIVKTPFLHGGMEYPALIYISDTVTGEDFKEVIIHETAHQWWYAAVGNDQIKESWLDEGLTSFSTTLFYDNNPSYNITKDERITKNLGFYLIYIDLYKENGKGDTSMNRAVYEYANSAEYNYMVYVKGELMLDDLYNKIGKEAFLNGLKKYYKENKLKIATTEIFIGTMESASSTDLKSFFSGWLEGKYKMYAN